MLGGDVDEAAFGGRGAISGLGGVGERGEEDGEEGREEHGRAHGAAQENLI